MTMHVNLSPEMEGFIKEKVASGFYGNATEVIRDAIRRMQTDDARSAAWQAAVAKGDAELDHGEGAVFTPELLHVLTQSAIDSLNNGELWTGDANKRDAERRRKELTTLNARR